MAPWVHDCTREVIGTLLSLLTGIVWVKMRRMFLDLNQFWKAFRDLPERVKKLEEKGDQK